MKDPAGRRGADKPRFDLLVQAVTGYAVCMIGLDGRIRSFNDGASRMTGYTADAAIGQPFAMLFTPEDRAAGKPERLLAAAREAGRASDASWHLRKDGSRFWAAVTLDPIHDDRGRLLGFANVARDLTGSSNAQHALAESERRFRLLVDGVSDYAIFMLDADGNITNWNTGAQRIKGYAAEEVIGTHFSRFYTEEDRTLGEPAKALAAAARRGKHAAEGRRVRKDGSRFWASVVLEAIRDETGALLGYAKITRDVSERRRAEEELALTQAALVQAQKMEAVGQLTGGVAHDFNNLLTVVLGNLDLLAQQFEGMPDVMRSLDGARRAAERGAKLTEQLLAFARRQPLRPEIVDVNASVLGFRAILQRALGEMIELRLELGDPIWPSRLDPAQLEATLLNLAMNARDAMPGGGTITVATRNAELDAAAAAALSEIAAGDYVEVSVSDTGEGMSAEVLAHALEPFFTTKEVGQGTGLGLSQAYGFVRQSGGQVKLESALGKGTRVRLFLPRATGRPDAVPEQEGRAAAAPLRGTALLVEDDADVLAFAAQVFREFGYEVLTAHSGTEALAALESGKPIDLLFTDLVMPNGMSGIDLARAARRRRPRLRVLLTSGYARSSLPDRRELGEDVLFLRKPYRLPELSDKLRRLHASG